MPKPRNRIEDNHHREGKLWSNRFRCVSSFRFPSSDLLLLYSFSQKNKEIESKESRHLELQYKIDELEAKADGWKASFEGLVTEAENKISSPDDVADILAASVERQEALSAEVAKLEEQCLRMDEDFRQEASMQKSIMDGLELKCEMLSQENVDICDELREKQDYINTLEEAKTRLEEFKGRLEADKAEVCRKLSDLQKTCTILRQQKADAETLSDDVVSGVKKLAAVANVYAARLEGFSSDSFSLTSWSDSLDYISRFIEHLSTKNVSSDSHKVSADALTPKARGSHGPIAGIDFAAQHTDRLLEDLESTKALIANALSSPKFTPVKSAKQETNVEMDDEGDLDLYSELMKAHEQLESLSEKIEAFRRAQRQWEDREASLQSRIVELEREDQSVRAEAQDLRVPDQARVREAGAVLVYNFQQRSQQAAVQRAFQTWKSQARVSKHLDIAREMAKELAQTRKKVLLLKSAFDESREESSDEMSKMDL